MQDILWTALKVRIYLSFLIYTFSYISSFSYLGLFSSFWKCYFHLCSLVFSFPCPSYFCLCSHAFDLPQIFPPDPPPPPWCNPSQREQKERRHSQKRLQIVSLDAILSRSAGRQVLVDHLVGWHWHHLKSWGIILKQAKIPMTLIKAKVKNGSKFQKW